MFLTCYQLKINKNSKFPSTGKAHVRPRTPHQCKQDILTDILVIYIDSHTDILYYYTQLVLMNCTSVHTIHINGIHTHTDIVLYIDSCTDILYYCTHLVQMDSTFVYTTVHIRLYCKFVPTNESPSMITLMNRVDQSQLRFLGVPFPSTTLLITAC